MIVYACKVYDGILGDWVETGVFSTTGKAMSSGSEYITRTCSEDVEIIDWDYSSGETWTDWYQNKHGRVFTRVVTRFEVDKELV